MKAPASTHTLPLLLEVGCEEIPARFLSDAQKELGERVRAALSEARLLVPVEDNNDLSAKARQEWQLQTYSTPRRLVVYAPEIRVKQPEKVEDVLGPPVKVAVDAEGGYTRAAESFVEKNHASLKDLIRTTTPKGEYLALRKATPGRAARELLPNLLSGAVLGLSFPKSMYWVAKSGPRFVRPIRWVLAVLGEGNQAKVIPLEVIGVKAGRATHGHRAAGKKAQRVLDFKDYIKKLSQSLVELAPAQRRERVVRESKVLLQERSLNVVRDDWLVDWVVNSTEWPRPLLGSFDERFLHLPREVLVTVMRDHQKYFAVEDPFGKLQPHFIAVLNMDSDPLGLIRQGHERVLTARFRDAEFFWNADQRVPLRDRLSLLEKVTYQADLGSYADKIRRTRAIADQLCRELEAQGMLNTEQSGHALRAVDLCKCDLTTQMVQEFTELQGVVGGLYAAVQGEPQEVADAIYDHYWPSGAEDRLPRTLVGALVSLADKLDSVVSGFAVGQEPTGSSDPFALRRAANGTIKVLLELRLPIDLRHATEVALLSLRNQGAAPREGVREQILDFFAERLRYYLESVRALRYDTVRAVLAARSDVPLDALARAEALEAIRGSENFEPLAIAAKRIRNILAKSATADDWQPGEVDEALLREEEERALWTAYRKVAFGVGELRTSAAYRPALEQISTLRPTVDQFFDKVLVMAEDRAIRQNRLRLLQKLHELFTGLAHFAEIATSGTT